MTSQITCYANCVNNCNVIFCYTVLAFLVWLRLVPCIKIISISLYYRFLVNKSCVYLSHTKCQSIDYFYSLYNSDRRRWWCSANVFLLEILILILKILLCGAHWQLVERCPAHLAWRVAGGLDRGMGRWAEADEMWSRRVTEVERLTGLPCGMSKLCTFVVYLL